MKKRATSKRLLQYFGPIVEQLTVAPVCEENSNGEGQSPAAMFKTRNILVSSGEPKEGRTTAAVGLASAAALSQRHKRVLLVDFDLRNPRVAGAMGLPNVKGAREVLSGQATCEDVIQATSASNLYVVTSGVQGVNLPDAFLALKDLNCFLNAAPGFDLVIYDTPPLNHFPEGGILSRLVDTSVLVIRAGRSKPQPVVDAKRILGGKLAGAIFNDFRSPIPSLLERLL